MMKHGLECMALCEHGLREAAGLGWETARCSGAKRSRCHAMRHSGEQTRCDALVTFTMRRSYGRRAADKAEPGVAASKPGIPSRTALYVHRTHSLRSCSHMICCEHA